MAYPALPDRRMPYDIDGTLVYSGSITAGATTVFTSTNRVELNDDDFTLMTAPTHSPGGGTSSVGYIWFFFPERREVTAYYFRSGNPTAGANTGAPQGSNDTTNGLDGTWETASVPAGVPEYVSNFSWRDGIKPVSFTGPKQTVRWSYTGGSSNTTGAPAIGHIYGEAGGGEMTHDLIFIDHDDTPGAEFTAPEDFGDQPLGTTVVRQFRIKNTSATRTAEDINLQCNDADFTIAEAAGGPWVVTINIASLGPGAESATFYSRCTTPAPGAPLQPRFSRITAICDAGFFG